MIILVTEVAHYGIHVQCNIWHILLKVWDTYTSSVALGVIQYTWHIHLSRFISTKSYGDVIKWNIFRVTGHRSPVKGQWRGALIFLHLSLNKRLSNQSWGWWFETPLRPLSRHCNVMPTQLIGPDEFLVITLVFIDLEKTQIGCYWILKTFEAHYVLWFCVSRSLYRWLR